MKIFNILMLLFLANLLLAQEPTATTTARQLQGQDANGRSSQNNSLASRSGEATLILYDYLINSYNGAMNSFDEERNKYKKKLLYNLDIEGLLDNFKSGDPEAAYRLGVLTDFGAFSTRTGEGKTDKALHDRIHSMYKYAYEVGGNLHAAQMLAYHYMNDHKIGIAPNRAKEALELYMLTEGCCKHNYSMAYMSTLPKSMSQQPIEIQQTKLTEAREMFYRKGKKRKMTKKIDLLLKEYIAEQKNIYNQNPTPRTASNIAQAYYLYNNTAISYPKPQPFEHDKYDFIAANGGAYTLHQLDKSIGQLLYGDNKDAEKAYLLYRQMIKQWDNRLPESYADINQIGRASVRVIASTKRRLDLVSLGRVEELYETLPWMDTSGLSIYHGVRPEEISALAENSEVPTVIAHFTFKDKAFQNTSQLSMLNRIAADYGDRLNFIVYLKTEGEAYDYDSDHISMVMAGVSGRHFGSKATFNRILYQSITSEPIETNEDVIFFFKRGEGKTDTVLPFDVSEQRFETMLRGW